MRWLTSTRVLLVTDIFPPQIGGPASFIEALAEYLTDHSFDVTVVCSSETRGDSSDESRRYAVHRVSNRNRYLYEIVIRMVLLWQIVLHRRILLNGLEMYCAPFLRFLSRRYIVKVVGDYAWERGRSNGITNKNIVDFQSSAVDQAPFTELMHQRRDYLTRATYVITPSYFLKDLVLGWGVPPARVHVILNGMHFSKSAPCAKAPGPTETFRVLFVGRLVNWKGVETLLLAAKSFENAEVLICGDGQSKTELIDLALQLGVEDKVKFLGRTSRPKVLALMGQSHALVLTSLYEGLSHTVLDAMSVGLPCVTSYCGGNRELIENGVNGILIPPQNPQILAEKIKELASDVELWQKLSMAAKGTVAKYQFDISAREYGRMLSTL